MSTKMMPSSRKPPLARSPIHLRPRPRPRRPLQSNPNTIQTPPGSLTKTQLPKSACEIEESGLRPEYRTISSEIKALAKMVHQEFSSSDWGDAGLVSSLSAANRSSLFERGRFYEAYSARRNERLKRKKGETGDGKKAGYDLGVRVESAKRRGETKRFEILRKTVPSTPMTERTQTSSSRYLLRSSTTSKENKKPPQAVENVDRSAGFGEKKIGVRRGRKN